MKELSSQPIAEFVAGQPLFRSGHPTTPDYTRHGYRGVLSGSARA